MPGAKNLALCPGEKVTEGLDGLRERLAAYFKAGARFAKWRAVITIGEGIPSHTCPLRQRARARALCCALPGSIIVPMIEPKVLLGRRAHDRALRGSAPKPRCAPPTPRWRRTTFRSSTPSSRPSMVVSGKSNARQAGRRRSRPSARCACSSAPCRRRSRAVVFLSGGQSDVSATAHLNAMAGEQGPALAADLLVFARAAEPGAQRLEGPERQRRRRAARLPPSART
jgi:fructose-bisphosphate aldolase class I